MCLFVLKFQENNWLLNRFKQKKGDKYEDLDGEAKVDNMDMTEPAMRRAAGIEDTTTVSNGCTSFKELRHNLSPVDEVGPPNETTEGMCYLGIIYRHY